MQLGLAETLQILIGCDQTDELGIDLAIRIETLFRDRCKEYKERYKLKFGVYCTREIPGEGYRRLYDKFSSLKGS